MSELVLWHFPISHYNEKARWALDWKRLPHRREVRTWDYVPRAWWATGQLRLPILFIDGRAVADSTAIIAALERLRPDPPLYPADPEARARALALEDFCDEELGHAVRAAILGPIFYDDPLAAIDILTTGMPASARRVIGALPAAFRAFYVRRHRIDRAAIAAERRKVRDGMNRIAAAVGPSGYLVGDRFTVADLTAAALLSSIAQPAELEYPLALPLHPLLEEYRSSVAHHPALRWTVEIYRKHRGAAVPEAAAGF